MNRLTRLLTPLNSPESHRLPITLPLRRDLTARFIAGISSCSTQNTPTTNSPHRQKSKHSPSPNRKITASAIPADRRNSHPRPTAMDSEAETSNSVEFEAQHAVEDFVHIEKPNPNVESLYDGIVGVDELRSDDVSAIGEAGAGGDDDGSDVRNVLPEELTRSVMVLDCESTAEGGSCDVYLVGTAHVSQESCREVQAVISFLKPQVVFLELCSSRVPVLTPQSIKVPTMREMVDMWKKKQNTFGILYSWFLAKVASKLEVFPGSEFRVAYEEAMKYGGKVILGDRPVHITLRRTWGKMPLWHKTKFLYSLLFQAVFLPSSEDLNKMLKKMDDVDVLTLVIQEMSKEFPTLTETLVHERDQYMSSKLLRVASEHSSVVAVVGKGHLQGIKKHWKQPVKMKDLMEIPSQKPAVSAVKIVSSLGVAVAGLAIISGIYLSCKK